MWSPYSRHDRTAGDIREQEAADDLADLAARDQRRRARDAMFLGVMGAVGLVGCVALWGIHDRETTGEVVKTEWQQQVYLDRWTQVQQRLWKHSTPERAERPPVDGLGERAGFKNLGECRREIHHHERYACGTRTVAKPDGGTRQETRYCQRPVRKTRCNYQTQRWINIRVAEQSGEGTDPRWPDVVPGELDRLRYVGTYQVHVAFPTKAGGTRETVVDWGTKDPIIGKPKPTLWKPPGEWAFRKWRVGDTALVVVNNFGAVTDVQKEAE